MENQTTAKTMSVNDNAVMAPAAAGGRTDTQKLLLRTLVENVYDAQGVRIAMGNRLVASLRDLGVVPSAAEEKGKNKRSKADDAGEDSQDKEDKENNKILVRVLDEFKLVSEVYAKKFDSKGSIVKALVECGTTNVFIKTDLTYSMVASFTQMSQTEQKMIDVCSREVKKHPLWDAFFKDVKGCGPLMAAVCIAYLDPYKARYPSSFWKYCGLDVVTDENGSHGRSRKDAYMVPYIDKNGHEAERRSLGYNPTVKTKLVGVLGSSFLRAGKEAQYAKVYYDYKNRLLNRPDCADLRPIVIHRRANRYAVKMFLKDLWYAWRTLEGLPTGEDYATAKLGMRPHHDPRNVPEGPAVSDEDVLAAALGAAAAAPGAPV